MKSLMSLLLEVLDESGTLCGVSTTRDRQTIASRVEHEGISFLTITLPTFGKDFESALDVGCVAPDSFQSFRKSARLPVFLKGFVEQVFDSRTGLLLDNPSIEAIRSVRQITLMLGKVLLPTTNRRNMAALHGYIECEKELTQHQKKLTWWMISNLRRVTSVLWGGVLSTLDREVDALELIPSHGPGSTADGLKGNQKFLQSVWHNRLEEYFPSVDYLLPNPRYWQDLERVQFLEPKDEAPAKVVLVPKTLKTPRIIAMEPTCMQYAQQALSRRLVELLEGFDNPFNWLVGFTDQTVSHRLAERGSREGNLATLDLSEASDRVSNLLVTGMFGWYPNLSGAIQACRSTSAEVPGWGRVPLTKFASMGSALCFPIEAMVFTAIVFLAIERKLGMTLNTSTVRNRSVLELSGQVRVYGDDLVVPSCIATDVSDLLEAYGLKVNRRKSFWTGKFRESCGKEFYDGEDVSIVRVRRVLPSSRRETQEVAAAVSYRNQLYFAGLWRCAEKMDRRLRKIIPWPTVHPSSRALGRHTLLDYQVDRMCPSLHRPLVKAETVYPVPMSSPLSGTGALLKIFLHQGSDPLEEGHLEFYGRPLSVRTKTRWVTPY